MKFKLLLVLIGIILLAAFSRAQLIDSDVLPFGPYSTKEACSGFYSNQRLQNMHDSLGINQFASGGFYDTTAQRFADHGIYVYPWGSYSNGVIEPQTKYAGVQYLICQAESTTGHYNTRFKERHGWVYQDSLWACRDSSLMLGGLTMLQTNKYAWLDQDNKLNYYPYLKIGVDSTTKADSLVTDTILVGIFKVWQHWPQPDTLRFIDSIYMSDLPYGHDTLLALSDSRTGYDPDSFYNLSQGDEERQKYMLFEFVKANSSCTLFVDYFKVHSQYGLQLIEDNQFANIIKQSTGREGYRGKILGWFIKDIQYPGNMRPFAYIDSLIQVATDDWGTNSVRAASHVVPFSGSGTWTSDDGYRDFVRYTHPHQMWSFLYPIWINTSYSGYSEDPNTSLQKGFETFLTIPCDSIRKALEMEFGSSWMYVPQYWYCDSTDADPCFGGEQRRKPTEAELRAMTYIGLCYQPKGIMFYKYDSHPPRPPWEKFTKGIVDSIGNPRPGMYNVIKDDISPYLKAIGPVYMGLHWERAYACSNGVPMSPPAGYFVSSISAISNTSDPNPDLGWFNAGEYTEGDDKYVMLVNRACSQGEWDPTEAPSITAMIHFNVGNLGLGDYVFITDLADSIRHAGSDTGWVGIPLTTYSAKMLDGTIPYTIKLRAGEGKLLKIAKTSKKL